MELLVVISIIALLIALLLPAMAHARESARMVQCQSNLRQIAIAIHTYENDNGRMPTHPFEMGDRNTFPATIKGPTFDARPLYEPYMNVDFFACPFVRPWRPSRSQAVVVTVDYLLMPGYYGDGEGDRDNWHFDNFWTRSDRPWRFNDRSMTVLAGDKAFRHPTGGIARLIVNHSGNAGEFTEWSPPWFAGSAFIATSTLDDDPRLKTANNFAFADGHVRVFGPHAEGMIDMPNRMISRPGSSYLIPAVP